jgi:hypothetical protein
MYRLGPELRPEFPARPALAAAGFSFVAAPTWNFPLRLVVVELPFELARRRRRLNRAMVGAALAAVAIMWAGSANAECVCGCVNGQVQAICERAIDPRPICTNICVAAPPVTMPVPQLLLPAPPIGATDCTQVQVLNPATNAYELRQVCR